MGAIDDAHASRAYDVYHDVLADLLYQRIRTLIQAALGYLRLTLAEVQEGVWFPGQNSSILKWVLSKYTRSSTVILQGTIVNQAETLPPPVLLNSGTMTTHSNYHT
jgi:hypothetical protein